MLKPGESVEKQHRDMMDAVWKTQQNAKQNGNKHVCPIYGGNVVMESIGDWAGTRIVIDEHYTDLPDDDGQDIYEGVTGMHNQAGDDGSRTLVTAYICHRNGDPLDVTNNLVEVVHYDGIHGLKGRKEIFRDPAKARSVIAWIAEEMVAKQAVPIPI